MRFLITTPCPLLKSRNTEVPERPKRKTTSEMLPVYRESCSRYVVSFGNKIPETPSTDQRCRGARGWLTRSRTGHTTILCGWQKNSLFATTAAVESYRRARGPRRRSEAYLGVVRPGERLGAMPAAEDQTGNTQGSLFDDADPAQRKRIVREALSYGRSTCRRTRERESVRNGSS